MCIHVHMLLIRSGGGGCLFCLFSARACVRASATHTVFLLTRRSERSIFGSAAVAPGEIMAARGRAGSILLTANIFGGFVSDKLAELAEGKHVEHERLKGVWATR